MLSPGFFEVRKISPPAESLGIHELPKNTHNGDQINVQGEDYVVRTLVLKYKLVGGRYERDHSRLDCTATSRFILDTYFDQLIAK
ncbi:hypothetical protein WJX81_007684 [Elliptochloris bilobata]|uniref:Uncharacterized protein n=1 Tax=Elliptochloris bilobata TaxID=381761 RepID=A0AAW1S7W0_9CHLO